MATQFCYRCASDTEFTLDGKKCTQCGLTIRQGKRFVNSVRKSTQDVHLSQTKTPTDQRSLFCHACNKFTQHDLQTNGNLWCGACGRDEAAALAFSKLLNEEGEKKESYVDSALATSIKLTLLFFLFPWSLLFLVIFYGFDGASDIIKKLFGDIVLLVFPIILIAILIGFFLLVMNNRI
jgi:hypothetical protein